MNLQIFAKDINYTAFNPSDKERLKSAVLQTLQEGCENNLKLLAAQLKQKLDGNQMWVSREVSDDLMASDIDDFDFGSVQWPHDTLEFYFEDPTIPTFLFHKRLSGASIRMLGDLAGVDDLLRAMGQRRVTDTDYVYDLDVSRRDGSATDVMFTLTCDIVDQFAAHGSDSHEYREALSEAKKTYNTKNAEDVQDAVRFLTVLAYKVLLFASSEGCAPRKTNEQPTKKQGGKPGFKGRPKKPRMIVEYLPRHRKERKDQVSEATGKTHEFNGRRGHWRVYKSDRFVQMKGKRQFIYPVPDKNGNYPKRQFRVVK